MSELDDDTEIRWSKKTNIDSLAQLINIGSSTFFF